MDSSLILGHATRVAAMVDDFVAKLDLAAASADMVVRDHLIRTLEVANGLVANSPGNMVELGRIDEAYRQAIGMGEYYPVIQEFVGSFSSQVGEFFAFFSESQLDVPGLGRGALSGEDMEVLSTMAGMAAMSLESKVLEVTSGLRKLASLMLGECPLSDLLAKVSSTVMGTSKVGSAPLDLVMTFFRMVGDLVYASVEQVVGALGYSYVGPGNGGSRDFCGALAESGAAYTRAQIDQMDNGQIPGVFDSCGGYGCLHWWLATEIVGEVD